MGQCDETRRDDEKVLFKRKKEENYLSLVIGISKLDGWSRCIEMFKFVADNLHGANGHTQRLGCYEALRITQSIRANRRVASHRMIQRPA